MSYDYLAAEDPQIADAIGQELSRQRSTIELIASENIASLAVMQAMGTVLTNKYAEGYSGKRYYGGCEKVDIAKKLQSGSIFCFQSPRDGFLAVPWVR